MRAELNPMQRMQRLSEEDAALELAETEPLHNLASDNRSSSSSSSTLSSSFAPASAENWIIGQLIDGNQQAANSSISNHVPSMLASREGSADTEERRNRVGNRIAASSQLKTGSQQNINRKSNITSNQQQQQQQQHNSLSTRSDQLRRKSHQSHHSQSEYSSSGRGTQVTRSVSRSMLALDKDNQAGCSFLVSWSQLNFSYVPSAWSRMFAFEKRARRRPQQVLRNLSGSIRNNQLVAVIGPSGCGKTTLLQLLSGNKRHQIDRLRISGLEAAKVSFIGQFDPLIGELTTRETLIYSSRLQNTEPNFQHEQHIEPVLKSLGLWECADRLVSRLSGGQAKRVQIAQELLYPTNLLILDEITSGLDANTSYSLVSQLKALTSDTSYPMTIVMSIHQPSAKLFSVFDKVYVMTGGRCLYEGSCKADNINSYLSQFGLECPKFTNIADFLIELASENNSTSEATKERLLEHHEHLASADPSYSFKHLRAHQLRHTRPRSTSPQPELHFHEHQAGQLAIAQAGPPDGHQEMDGMRARTYSMLAQGTRPIEQPDEDLTGGAHLDQAHLSFLMTTPSAPPNSQDVDVETSGRQYLLSASRRMSKSNIELGKLSNLTSHQVSLNMLNMDKSQMLDSHSDSPNFRSLMSDHSKSYCLYQAIEKARNKREKPFVDHFKIHFARASIRNFRNYILAYMQLFTFTFLALQLTSFFGPEIGKASGCPSLPMSFIGYILSDGEDTEMLDNMSRLQENINFVMVAVMTATFASLEITVITFPIEARTITREWRNGRYTVSSYFMGRTLADLPALLVCLLIFCSLTYSQTSQYGSLLSWRFLCYCYIITCVSLIAQTVGLVAGAIFMDSLPLAVFIGPLSIFPTLLFSGFYARLQHIPVVYRYLSYLSHYRYVFEALILTLYGQGRCSCDQTTLNQYHESLHSQTNIMRDLFKNMVGSTGCPVQPTDDMAENTIEDSTGFSGDINSIIVNDTTTMASNYALANDHAGLLGLVLSSGAVGGSSNTSTSTTTTTTTTPRPMKAFEDALLESVYAHMNQSTSGGAGEAESGTAVESMMNKFTGKVTQMFNSRSNFGRPVPERCEDFNSCMISEFQLENNDLISNLLILTGIVLISRLLCNLILNITIRTKVG